MHKITVKQLFICFHKIGKGNIRNHLWWNVIPLFSIRIVDVCWTFERTSEQKVLHLSNILNIKVIILHSNFIPQRINKLHIAIIRVKPCENEKVANESSLAQLNFFPSAASSVLSSVFHFSSPFHGYRIHYYTGTSGVCFSVVFFFLCCFSTVFYKTMVLRLVTHLWASLVQGSC